MLKALTAILVCQLVGEAFVAASGLPIPGPVLGMAILFFGFVARGGIPNSIASVGDGLLKNLAVLFVPAGVGIMQHANRIGSEGLQLGGTLIASTLVTIAVTGWIMTFFMRSERANADRDPDNG